MRGVWERHKDAQDQCCSDSLEHVNILNTEATESPPEGKNNASYSVTNVLHYRFVPSSHDLKTAGNETDDS